MAKYSKELDENLKSMVTECVRKAGIENVVEVKPISMLKSNGPIIEVVKSNALAQLFTGGEIIAVAIFEDVMLQMTPDVQMLLIENAVSQISYDLEKDKVNISKPEISVSIGMRGKYGEKIINAIEAGYLAVQQHNEIEKQRKAEEKAAKKNK